MPGEHGSRPAHAALDLIKDQEDPLLVAEGTQPLEKVLRRGHQAALALDGLNDDRAGLVGIKGLDAVQVIETRELNVAGHLAEGLAVMGIARDRQGPVGPAVEGILHGDDLVAPAPVLEEGVLHGGLESSLDRLRAAVGKEDPVHAGGLLHPGRRPDRGLIVEIVGCVQNLVDLGLEGIIVGPVAVAQGKDGDPGHEVQVFFAVHIIEIHALAPVQDDLVAVIGVEQVLLGLLDH